MRLKCRARGQSAAEEDAQPSVCREFPWSVCRSGELGRASPFHTLLYQLPGLGSGASLSAAAGIYKPPLKPQKLGLT